jgi:PAS domain S-box-containing protein
VLAASPDKLTFQSPELWVYMLGLSTLLGIALRRVLAKQAPLNDELYSKTVAIEYVQSGVAWVRADGTIKTINQSFSTTLGFLPRELLGRCWYDLFAQQDRDRLKAAHDQVLLLGTNTIKAHGLRADGTYAMLEVLLVAVHDHKMRFVGHHCLVSDRTREQVLEDQLRELNQSLVGTNKPTNLPERVRQAR